MTGLLSIALVLIALAIGIGAVWLFIALFRAIMSPTTPTNSRRSDTAMTPEEESYAHSGPHGYSANTAYPQTQYGSGFNPDAEWNENRRDRHDHEEEW